MIMSKYFENSNEMSDEQKQRTLEMMYEGKGLLISKTEKGFGFMTFGEKNADKVFETIAENVIKLLKEEKEGARQLIIQLLSIIALVATADSDTYRALKGILKDVQKMRNEDLNDNLGFDLEKLIKGRKR